MVKCWIRIISGIFLGLMLLLVSTTFVRADGPPDVEITVYAWVVGSPSGLTLTYINDQEIELEWAKGEDAQNTMVRAKYGSAPTSRTDGYLVYYGDGTSCTDTEVDLDELSEDYFDDEAMDFNIYYRLWSQNEGGAWEPFGISDLLENPNVTLLALFIFAGILSYLGIKSNFVLLRLMGGAGWLAMFIYWITSPPSAITEGSAAHVAVAVVLIGMTVAIPLVGLGREVTRQTDWRSKEGGGYSESSQGFRLKLPDWMRSSEAKQREYRQQRQRDIGEYRDRIHRALHPNEGERRRR